MQQDLWAMVPLRFSALQCRISQVKLTHTYELYCNAHQVCNAHTFTSFTPSLASVIHSNSQP